MKQELISVVIPAYNAEKYLKEAIESVLKQTYRTIEIIVVDNASTDSTAAIVKKIKDPRVKYAFEPFRGSPRVRNTGIRKAKGKYIALLDADDLWKPTKLQEQMRMIKSGYGFVFTAIRRFGEGAFQSRQTKLHAIDAISLIKSVPLVPSCVLTYRNAFVEAGYFDERFTAATCDDLDMWLRIYKLGKYKFGYISRKLVLYRMHSGQTSKKLNSMCKNRVYLYGKLLDDPYYREHKTFLRNKLLGNKLYVALYGISPVLTRITGLDRIARGY